MTLGQLINFCEDRTGFRDSGFRGIWRGYINAAVRDFARKHPWAGLERQLDITLLAGERLVTLPHHVDHVRAIINRTDNMEIIARGNWENQAPSSYAQRSTGTPLEYRDMGLVATARDPSGYIFFHSSHASDSFTIFATGYAAASGSSNSTFDTILQTTSADASGTAAVTLPVQFSQVISISRATNSNGNYFFFDAGDSNRHISYIPASELEARFRRLEFMFVPNVNKTLTIRYIPVIPNLIDENQSPHPIVKPDYILEKAIGLWQRYQSQYGKAQSHDAAALETLAGETNKETNFGEPISFLAPEFPATADPESDYYRDGL